MEFRLLGPFEAWQDGTQLDLGDLQQRYVLIVLLRHANRPVPTGRLVDIVWSGQEAPRTNLIAGYVARLRKTFRTAGADDVLIDTTPTGYLLRVDEEYLDTVRFARLCGQADQAKQNGDLSTATAHLREALGLWRGRFLEDIDIERVGGGDVISPEDARLDAVCDLAELELAAGNHRWVRDQLRLEVRADPTRQRLAILLMRALLANGDRVQAIEIYRKCEVALDVYGLTPSAELRGLALMVRSGNRPNTLPPRASRFVGRAHELSLVEKVADRAAGTGAPAVVWVSGPPGVGKTTLAVEAASRLRAHYPDAQMFLSLNGFTPSLEPTAPSDAMRQLLGDLGVPTEDIPAAIDDRVALLRTRLTGTRTLLVLDNAATEDQLRALLAAAPGCMAIVTSRKAGNLDVDVNLRLTPLSEAEAAELFGRLVGKERVAGRSAEIEQIVARCGRLPLLIRVVAAQFRRHPAWSPADVLRLLRETGLRTIHTGLDDASMATITASYNLLDPMQQKLFYLFGAIPSQDVNAFGSAALLNVDLVQAHQVLDSLHAVSLLEETTPGRYHMLPPLREFAQSLPPPASSDIPGVQWPSEGLDRLLDFYLVTAAAAIASAFPADRDRLPLVTQRCPVTPSFDDQPAALAWLAAERTNLIAAVHWAAQHHRPDHAWQLAVQLWPYFDTIDRLGEWITTLEVARQNVVSDQASRLGKAEVLLRLSIAYRRRGDFARALELAAQSLPHWVQLRDDRAQADTLHAIALTSMELGDRTTATAHLEAALATYRLTGDRRGEANALSALGQLSELHGNLDAAVHQLSAALVIFRSIGHRRGEVHSLNDLGSVMQRSGRLEQALVYHRDALWLAERIDDHNLAASALIGIGRSYRQRGEIDTATRYHEQANAQVKTFDDLNLRVQLQLDRGATYLSRGDHRVAQTAYGTALELATMSANRGWLAHAHLGLAQALHLAGQHEQATQHWQAAETEFDELHQPEADESRRVREALDCACALPAVGDIARANAEAPR